MELLTWIKNGILNRIRNTKKKISFNYKLISSSLFYRFNTLRLVSTLIRTSLRINKPLGIAHIIAFPGEEALGPIQREEAIFLFGLIRTIRPQTVVEFGFSEGHSAFNFYSALPKSAHLYSYDISVKSKKIAGIFPKHEERFFFLHKSQTEFDHSDIHNRPVNFVFFDAAHDFELNQQTFKKIEPHLAEDAVIAVHDTGIWLKRHMSKIQKQYIESWEDNRWISEKECTHQPGERKFVNWISETYSNYNSIHLHTTNTLRHGITLLQKRKNLKV